MASDAIVFDFVRGEVRRTSLAEINASIRGNCREQGHIFATRHPHESAPGDYCICGGMLYEDWGKAQ